MASPCMPRRAARRPLILASLAAATCGAAACSADVAGRRTTVEVTDSAGVPIAFTRIADDAPACEVSGEVLRIGAVDETDGPTLFFVNGAAFLDDGRLAVVNVGTSQVLVFSPAGELVHALGREGDGPGEFRNLWSVHVRGGDTLVVGDYMPWRFSYFTPEGEFVRQVELKPLRMYRPDFAIPLAPGMGFVKEHERSAPARNEFVDRVEPLLLYDAAGDSAGTVGEFWLERFGFLSPDLPGYTGGPIFGAQASFAYLGGDRILYATGRHERLEVWSAAGELERVIRWRARDREVSPADADAWRRQQRQAAEARMEITPRTQRVLDARFGEQRPVAGRFPGHDQVVVSREGDIWVEEYRRPLDGGPGRWWVFAPDGRFRCAASLPADMRVLAVGHDRVIGLTRDALDVEYLAGYDVGVPPALDP